MFDFFAMTMSDFSYVLVAQNEDGPPELLTVGGQLFYSFLIFVFVLALAYYLTKVISTKRMQVLNSKNIKVLEVVSLGVGVSMGIVQVGEKYLLVSMSKEKISLITELDSSTLVFNENGSFSYNFSEQFKKLLNKDKGEDE